MLPLTQLFSFPAARSAPDLSPPAPAPFHKLGPESMKAPCNVSVPSGGLQGRSRLENPLHKWLDGGEEAGRRLTYVLWSPGGVGKSFAANLSSELERLFRRRMGGPSSRRGRPSGCSRGRTLGKCATHLQHCDWCGAGCPRMLQIPLTMLKCGNCRLVYYCSNEQYRRPRGANTKSCACPSAAWKT